MIDQLTDTQNNTLQWYTVKGTITLDEVLVDMITLAESPEAAEAEALALVGTGAIWKDAPIVELADREDAD